MIALLVALGLAALISLQPWATTSVVPQLSVAPGLGIALGDAVEVSSPDRRLAVAAGRPAVGGKARLAAGGIGAREGDSRQGASIAPARAVVAPQPNRSPGGAPKPPASEPVSQPPPESAPVAVPVSAPAPASVSEPTTVPPVRAPSGSHSPGPIVSGPGPIGEDPAAAVEVHEGDENAFSFSFVIEPAVYRSPGDENLIVRFKVATSESPSFGLQLWDDGSGAQRGLWASGDAMGGERFLAPVEEGVWHEAVVYFQASSEDDGAYVLTLDGEPVDVGAWISLIEPGSDSTWLETGLFRDGERVLDASDVFFGPTRLGDTLEPVIP